MLGYSILKAQAASSTGIVNNLIFKSSSLLYQTTSYISSILSEITMNQVGQNKSIMVKNLNLLSVFSYCLITNTNKLNKKIFSKIIKYLTTRMVI
jgi:hypothetical protein